jgi:TusA-related sulfurtransferase
MQIDVRGEICPYPMLKAVEAMKKLKGGGEVVMITDHAPCLETIPPQAARYSYDCEISQTGSPEWTIRLRPKAVTR